MIVQVGLIAFQGCQVMALANRPSNDRRLLALFLAVNTGWIIKNQRTYFKGVTLIPFSLLGITAYRYGDLLINAAYQREDPQPYLTKKEKLVAQWASPFKEKSLRMLLIVQTAQWICCFILGKNRLFATLYLAGAIATLYFSIKDPWIKVTYHSKIRLRTDRKMFPKPTLTFYGQIYKSKEHEDEKDGGCPVCFDPIDPFQGAFYCTQKHLFHISCLVNSLATTVYNCGEKIDPKNLSRRRNSRIITLSLPEEIPPHCPTCREKNPHSVLKFNLGTVKYIQPAKAS